MGESKLIQSKNIVISTQCFPPVIGGIETLIKGLADSLYKNKFNIYIFADSKNPIDEKKYDIKLNYEIIRYKGLKLIRRRKKSLDINKFINFKKNINFIICDTWKSAENLVKTEIINNTKLFCLAHGNDILTKKSLIRKRRIKKVFTSTKYIIANSYFTKKKIENLGVNSRKIKVIYPGINKEEYSLKEKNKFFNKFKNFNPILITIARLEKRKNHQKIIYAINDLVKEHKKLIYLIAGDGPEKKKISKIIKKLNLEKNIKILGKVNDSEKAFLLDVSDLFVMPTIDDKYSSSIEGFGISYIEAGMYGLPSISSGIGGTKESIINNKTGIICNSTNTDSIKNSIKAILNNKKKYKKMSLNAKKFSEKFLWNKVIKNYLNILK
tara:strand:- start:104 stop:1249 length:1146 start_codon:yes stop_codon:yes gene_type:complete